jgi:hypothetical protein
MPESKKQYVLSIMADLLLYAKAYPAEASALKDAMLKIGKRPLLLVDSSCNIDKLQKCDEDTSHDDDDDGVAKTFHEWVDENHSK